MIPNWAKGAVYYQIFPDRFCNGDSSNNVKTGEYAYQPGGEAEFCADWNALPKTTDVHRFYGGDIEGVWDKLPYLKSLGIEVLLFNPIFKSPSNHKYDTTDYDEIDFHLTSKRARNQKEDRDLSPNEYFAYFVEAVHEAGMKIVLDGVFNHCGSENAWALDPDKADYFSYDESGERETWWGVETLPKLNYDGSEKLREEVLRIAAKWVSAPYNCDGWRLDVAADLGHSAETNHSFWKAFNDAVKKANPEAIVFAEHYGDASSWMHEGSWDTVMNYDGFMEPLSWFFTGVDKHCDNENLDLIGDAPVFTNALLRAKEWFPEDSYLCAINQIDNHDHARYTTRTSGKVGRLATLGSEAADEGVNFEIVKQTVIFQMTWPGAPTLYYGDETGMTGWTDPDSRRTFPWGRENQELIDYYKYAIRLHKSSKVFRTGAVKIVYAEDGAFAFARYNDEETFVTIINRNDFDKEVVIRLEENGIAGGETIRVFESRSDGELDYNVGHMKLGEVSSVMSVMAKPLSATVINITQR